VSAPTGEQLVANYECHEATMKLKVLLHPAEEGGFWAEVPALPGCVSEGDTLDEALANIREAAEGWLEVSAEQTDADPQAQIVEVEL
jgi:predicted RNase H-like HicB family nuclease